MNYRKRRVQIPDLSLLSPYVFLSISVFVFLVLLYFVIGGAPGLGECVAVVRLNGVITTESTPPTLFDEGIPGSLDYVNLFKTLDKMDNVKAVLLEINSPGGSVVASNEIYTAFKSIKKPKVAYIREIGASGGYYVANGADYIISHPDAITGSIGVITTFVNLRKLLEDLGVNVTSITGGKNKDMGAFYKDLTPEQRKIIESMVNEIHQEFKDLVKENRGDKLKNFEQIADGRIMTGRQALEYGLVDEVGDFNTALRKAADLAGMSYDEEPQKCVFYPLTSSPFAGALGGLELNLRFDNQGGIRLE